MLGKAEYWRLYLSDFAHASKAEYWAEVAHYTELHCAPDGGVYIGPVDRGDYVAGAHRCFPVSIAPDGTETRLECPQMPDEPLIEELQDAQVIHRPAPDVLGAWVFCAAMIDDIRDIAVFAPTPEHYPRMALGGPWVWSTRK